MCEQYSRPNKVAPIPILTRRPLELIMFDLSKVQGVVDGDGNVYQLLVVMDHFSKYLWTTIVSGKDPKPIAKFLIDTFSREGTPERWHADNGGEFRNCVLDDVREQLVKLDPNNESLPFSRSQPRHPECQGLVEKMNDTLKKKIFKALLDVHNKYLNFLHCFETTYTHSNM